MRNIYEVKAKEKVYGLGESSNSLYLVLTGTVVICQQQANRLVIVGEIGPYGVFGQLEHERNSPLRETVAICRTDCLLQKVALFLPSPDYEL